MRSIPAQLGALAAAAAALAAVAVLPLSAGAAPDSARPRVFGVHGTITHIAADGTRVALAVRTGKGACDRVVTWNEAARTYSRITAGTHCPDSPAVDLGITAVALGNTRVAWIEQVGGNLLDTTVQMARLGQAKPTMVAFAENGNGAGGPDDSGDHLGDLYGDGSLLAYDGWHVCIELPPGNDPGGVVSACPTTSTSGQPVAVTSKETLTVLTNGHRAVAHRGADAIHLVAVDGGRLAVAHAGGVTLYSARGAPLRTLPVTPAVTQAALSGHLLTLAAPGRLETYDVSSGALRKTVAVGRNEVLRDLQGTTAVLVDGRRVHALNVLTGKGFRLTAPGAAPVDARLEPSGLFYSYALPRNRSAVAFRPLAWVTGRIPH